MLDDEYVCEDHVPSNLNKTVICNWKYCLRTNNLERYARAQWCPEHLNETLKHRAKISPHLGTDDERKARLEEIKVRKDQDAGHIYYYLQLMSEHIKNKDNVS